MKIWKEPGNKGRQTSNRLYHSTSDSEKIMDCKAYPGIELYSDYNIMMIKNRLSLKNLKKRKETTQGILKN